MFTVLEMQTTDGTTAVLKDVKSDLNTAYQKYHMILAAAAVSDVDIHAAVILDQFGDKVASEYFRHDNFEVSEG